MPTYQYSCTDCGHAFEQFQSFSDDSLTVCPACEGKLRKIFNAVGVVFKGSGFYRTDSRTDGASSTQPAANGSSTKTESTKTGSGTSGSEKSDASTGSSAASSTGGSSSSNGASTSSSSSSTSGTAA